MIGLFFHLDVAFPYGLGHFALAHVFPDNGIACVDGFLGFIQDVFEIGFTASESCGSKQENLLISQYLQQLKSVVVGNALVGPKAYVDRVGLGLVCGTGTEIVAAFRGQLRG